MPLSHEQLVRFDEWEIENVASKDYEELYGFTNEKASTHKQTLIEMMTRRKELPAENRLRVEAAFKGSKLSLLRMIRVAGDSYMMCTEGEKKAQAEIVTTHVWNKIIDDEIANTLGSSFNNLCVTGTGAHCEEDVCCFGINAPSKTHVDLKREHSLLVLE